MNVLIEDDCKRNPLPLSLAVLEVRVLKLEDEVKRKPLIALMLAVLEVRVLKLEDEVKRKPLLLSLAVLLTNWLCVVEINLIPLVKF